MDERKLNRYEQVVRVYEITDEDFPEFIKVFASSVLNHLGLEIVQGQWPDSSTSEYALRRKETSNDRN